VNGTRRWIRNAAARHVKPSGSPSSEIIEHIREIGAGGHNLSGALAFSALASISDVVAGRGLSASVVSGTIGDTVDGRAHRSSCGRVSDGEA